MSNLPDPNDYSFFATLNDTVLDGDFAAYRDYFNCVGGGIDASNLSSAGKFQPDQVAENRSLECATYTLPLMLGMTTPTNAFLSLPVYADMRVVAMRMTVRRGTSPNVSQAFATLWRGDWPLAVNANDVGYLLRVTYDDSSTDNKAYVAPVKPLNFSAGDTMTVYVTTNGNVALASVQVFYSVAHTSR